MGSLSTSTTPRGRSLALAPVLRAIVAASAAYLIAAWMHWTQAGQFVVVILTVLATVAFGHASAILRWSRDTLPGQLGAAAGWAERWVTTPHDKVRRRWTILLLLGLILVFFGASLVWGGGRSLSLMALALSVAGAVAYVANQYCGGVPFWRHVIGLAAGPIVGVAGNYAVNATDRDRTAEAVESLYVAVVENTEAVRQLKTTIDSQSEQIGEQTRTIDRLNGNIGTLKAESASLLDAAKKNEATMQEQSRKIDSQTGTIDGLTAQLGEASSQIVALRADVREGKERNEELARQILDAVQADRLLRAPNIGTAAIPPLPKDARALLEHVQTAGDALLSYRTAVALSRYADADRLETAAEAAARKQGPAALFWFHSSRADRRGAEEKWEDSAKDYQAAAAIRPQDARIRLNLSFTYFQYDRIDDARAQMREAVRLYLLDNPSGSVDLAEALYGLSLIERRAGNAPAALTPAADAVRIMEQRQGPDSLRSIEFHMQHAMVVSDLAAASDDRAMQAKARDEAKEAARRVDANPDAAPADRGSVYSDYGVILFRLGESAAAEAALKRAVEFFDRGTPPPPLALGITLSSLSRLQFERGAVEEAKKSINRAVPLLEKVLAPDDANMVKAKARQNEINGK
ncbi:MAG: hypothetical protein AB7G11_05620 [Phycisphaerales bacterium]